MKWSDIEISHDGTYHIRGGRPLYTARFDEVLKFHAPGLAPVRRGREAWHIDITGDAVYSRRFLRTFGFYEERAAVVATDGWHHILPDGRDCYPDRYAWCGNFQEGRCPVRRAESCYLHIDSGGAPVYDARWRYAGDFRDGFAVVQAEDGHSTHIDTAGVFVHGIWFLDLDVFHKGYARARDEDGWTHIDRTGRPLYPRRFAAVEPFYNGQARVERFDGALEIIDEAGRPVIEPRPPLQSQFAALSADLVGFWRTGTICTAVELGVLEVLPASTSTISMQCALNRDRARRLMKALQELRLVTSDGGEWFLTPRGAFLRKQDDFTLADAALEYGRHFTRMWERLPDAIRDKGHWSAPDVFGEVARDPARTPGHHRMLRSYARHDYAAVPRALRLRGDETVIDAGGGLGVLSELLIRQYPNVRVILLDRPEVIGLIEANEAPREQLTRRAVDLFAPWRVRGDVVLMARVLHDWEDDEAIRLVRHARECLPTGGRLFVVEMVKEEQSASGSLCDLHLLMATGGRERSVAAYTALLNEAGFDLLEVVRLPALPSMIVGVAK